MPRWVPDQRRHGDPFPVPPASSELVAQWGLSKEQQGRVSLARGTLNRLAAATPCSFNGVRDGACNRGGGGLRPETFVQTEILQSLCRRVAAVGERPSDLTAESSLAEMLSAKDLYSQEPKNLVEFNMEGLKVARNGVRPKDALPMLPPLARTRLRNFKQHIEKDDLEVAADAAINLLVKP
jgi:hypothetical protein